MTQTITYFEPIMENADMPGVSDFIHYLFGGCFDAVELDRGKLSFDAVDPDRGKLKNDRGSVYAEVQEYARAIEHLQAVIEIQTKITAHVNTMALANAAKARGLLDSMLDKHDRCIGEGAARQAEPSVQFTAVERGIALMLIEGASQREIARKYGFSAEEVKKRVSAIREKVVRSSDADQTIAAVAFTYSLTRRETEVLRLLRENAGNDLIADELALSGDTVRFHVRNLLKKLSIDSRLEVAVWLEGYERVRS